MQRKFIHIFTITLLSICLIEANTYAQENSEDELPIKQETPVSEKDSVANNDESVVEEPKNDISPVIITPGKVNPNILFPEGETNSQKPAKNAPVNGDKAKEADNNKGNLRFNLLYYLFYKVKVGSSSGTSN